MVVACRCGQQFRAPPHLAGKRVKCPACGDPLDIVAQRAAAPAFDPLGDLAHLERSAATAAAPVSHWPAPAWPANPRKPFPVRRVVGISAITLLVLVFVVAPIAVLVGGGIYGFRRGWMRAARRKEALTQSADAPWKEFVSPEKEYTVQMPALVYTETSQSKMFGGETELRLASNRAGQMFFSVAVCDIPPSLQQPEILDVSVDTLLANNPDFNVLSRSKKFGVIELRYESMSEGVNYLHVLHFESNGPVFFLLETSAPVDKFSDEQAQRFIDSFRASKP